MTAHKTEVPALPLLIPDLIPGDGSININLQNSNIEAFVSMSIHEKKNKNKRAYVKCIYPFLLSILTLCSFYFLTPPITRVLTGVWQDG